MVVDTNHATTMVLDAPSSSIYSTDLTVHTVVRANRLGGSFQVEVGTTPSTSGTTGATSTTTSATSATTTTTTTTVPHDATAAHLRAALLSLTDVVTDDVAVLRSNVDGEGGRTWYVVFLNEYVDGHPMLLVDGSGLSGLGSGSITAVVQRGGSHGRMVLPRTEGLALGKCGWVVVGWWWVGWLGWWLVVGRLQESMFLILFLLQFTSFPPFTSFFPPFTSFFSPFTSFFPH